MGKLIKLSGMLINLRKRTWSHTHTETHANTHTGTHTEAEVEAAAEAIGWAKLSVAG